MTLNFFIMYLALLLFIYHRCYSLIESLKVIIVASALPMTCQTHRAPYVRSPPKTPVSGCFSVSQMALSPHDAMLAKRHLEGPGLQPAQKADKQLNLCSERFISIRGLRAEQQSLFSLAVLLDRSR